MTVTSPRRHAHSIKSISSAIALAFLAINLVILLFIQDDWARAVWIDVIFPPVNFLAVVALLYAAQRKAQTGPEQSPLSRALRLLALAQFCYFLGDLTWMILEVVLLSEPFPSLADGFYLAYYPLCLLGIWKLPAAPAGRYERLKALLDMTVVLLAAGLLVWVLLVGPLALSVQGEPFASVALSLAYPLGDLLLLAGILVLAYRRSQRLAPGALRLLALSLGVCFFTDCVFSYQSIIGTYRSGDLLDLLWMASFLLLMLFAVWLLSDQPGPDTEIHPAPEFRLQLKLLLDLMPYVWLASVFGLLAWSASWVALIRFETLVGVVAAIVALVLLRQIVTLQENSRLSWDLQSAFHSLRAQAQALELSNQELQNEIEMRKRAEQQLLHEASHDALTDLPNRVLFLDHLRRAMAYAQRQPDFHFAVLFLDMDHFKVINDCLGHNVGDRLLVEFARQLRQSLRESDMVARLGGDEFVILLEGIAETAQVEQLTESILNRISGPYFIEGHKIFASASIGVVYSDQDFTLAEDMLRDADVAMYQAKALGRARAEVFKPDLRERLIERMHLEADLRRALENEEFCLYYQPIVALHSGVPIGFEALLRWERPEHGLVSPAEFIQLAEETGLILPLGSWALREACRQAQEWRKRFPAHRGLTISVNISGFQFRQPDLVDEIVQALADAGLEGDCLCLEITESVYLQNPEAAIITLKKLKALGIRFHIDDFGTGYSSLSYLQTFPIETIKIDRSFIRKLTGGEHSEILRTVIALAHELGMTAVAEGIETEEQRERLIGYGCDYAQGFWFAPPLSVAEVERRLQSSIIL